MNNQKIIDQRWKKTESLFRSNINRIRQLYYDTGDEIIEIIDLVKPEYSKLNKRVPDAVKRTVDRKIKDWKKQGIVTGYFAFLVMNLVYTYDKVLEILILGAYLTMDKKLYDLNRRIFEQAINDLYNQGRRDLELEEREMTWDEIQPLLLIPALNESYANYQQAVNITASQEMHDQIIVMLRSGIVITALLLKRLLLKQANRILKVNNDKYSGAVVDVTRASGNKAYTQASDKDQLLLFVAEMDDRTTKMCRSLDGQIFHTKKWNIFYRYSEFYQAKHKFSCKGMEIGLNLPPINDHFHWCRSTVTYQID